ncbi:cytochrome P450 [Xylariomycetidae sp. FL0641]|nr:cytochrome P450 [Xylariomycetidae sp. FL0641]
MASTETLYTAGGYAVGLFVAYWLSVAAYRLLLHPLRDYPGPFMAKLTEGYGGYYAATQRYHLVIKQLHDKYGMKRTLVSHPGVVARGRLRKEIQVRWYELGPTDSSSTLQPPYMVSSPGDPSGTSSDYYIYENDRLVKSHHYLLTLGFTGVTNVWSEVNQAAHRRKRRLISPGLSERAMRAFEPTLQSQIDIFLRQLLLSSSSSPAVAVDISERSQRLTLDVMGHLAFGYALGTQTTAAHRALGRGVRASSAHQNVLLQWPRLRSRLLAFPLHCLTYLRQRRAFRLVEHMIRVRMAAAAAAAAEGGKGHDFFAQVVGNYSGDISDFRLSDIWSESLFLIPAGSDTTATTISALLFYLSRTPRAYARLAHEIRSAFASRAAIRGGPRLAACAYLRASIDEALRLASPANGPLWRELPPSSSSSSEVTIDGHAVPAGVQVGASLWAVHRDAGAFAPDPYAFRPERWLDDDGSAAADRGRAAFAPFQLGSRGCPGRPLAYLETGLVVAQVLWLFDFARAPGAAGALGGGRAGDARGRHRVDEFQLYDTFASDHQGPNLVFRARAGVGVEEELASLSL